VHRYEPSGGRLFILALIHADPPGDHAFAHQRLLAVVGLVHRHTDLARVLRQTELQFLGPLQVFVSVRLSRMDLLVVTDLKVRLVK
jgi:hypothetical protein